MSDTPRAVRSGYVNRNFTTNLAAATGAETSVDIGQGSVTDDAGQVALLGDASSTHSVAIGFGSVASGGQCVAIGDTVEASGAGAIAIGHSIEGNHPVADTIASGADSIAMGISAASQGDNSIALGNTVVAVDADTVAIGASTTAGGNGSVAVGHNNITSGVDNVLLGNSNTANSGDAGVVIIGNGITAELPFTVNYVQERQLHGTATTTDGTVRTFQLRVLDTDGQVVEGRLSLHAWDAAHGYAYFQQDIHAARVAGAIVGDTAATVTKVNSTAGEATADWVATTRVSGNNFVLDVARGAGGTATNIRWTLLWRGLLV